MNRLARLARRFADAALQLTLPLFDLDVQRAPREPPSRAPSPDRARQAEGTRAIRLRSQQLQYKLRRSRRRTIGFSVDEYGLTVSAPRWVGIAEIESALDERGDWILRKMGEFRELVARRERDAIQWEHGGSVPFLGRRIVLRVVPQHRGAPQLERESLAISLPPAADSRQLRDLVHGWLQARAREHFAARIAHFSRHLGVQPSRWALSSARTRWGSCTADGSIRLNWRLIHLPERIVDYVICHELAHLVELNHSARFWGTVGELFPEHREARRWLREHNEPGE
ncbi:MAG: M48 family metallopeptidase [Burkholderiaceae bacterium]|nr:M48 family metallopeptidase [Burkholderiaceae bacterium]